MHSPVTRSAPLLPAGSPRIVGIVNITADSFSDGGRYLDPAAALAHARRLRADGDIHGFGDPGLYPVLAASPCRLVVMHAVQADGIRELKETFGVAVLVSPSRKSFLRALTGRDVTRAGPATLAAEIFAAWQGADYIRTHDVAAARDAFAFLSAVSSEAAHA